MGGHPDRLQSNIPRPPSATLHLFLGEKNIGGGLPRTPPGADLAWLKPREGHQHQTDKVEMAMETPHARTMTYLYCVSPTPMPFSSEWSSYVNIAYYTYS